MSINNNIPLGTNLSSISYYSSQVPFLDEMKSSKSWITQNQQTWNTQEQNLLELDDNGWVKSLPSEGAEANYTRVGTLLFRGHNNYLPGDYIVTYEGEGEIEYRFDATKKEALSSSGRDVIEVSPSDTGIFLSITETDSNKTGNYIRNIRVIHEDSELIATTETAKGGRSQADIAARSLDDETSSGSLLDFKSSERATFNPAFLEKIQPFDTLRFMDWMETNNSEQKEWVDRPKLEDARYSEVGAPVEIMVELANQTDTIPWFTMPHLATDEYVENFANYVKDNLEPSSTVYVEYSNEVWNWNFEQARWVDQQAKQEWHDSDLNRLDWYSKRTTEVVGIWDDVFNNSERVVGVMSAQAANLSTGERVLNYNWSENGSLSHSDTGIDAIAIAPYFGGYIGDPSNESIIEGWTREDDGGVDKLFQEITGGGLLTNSPEGGALIEAYDNIEDYAELAEAENLQLLAYEGGQHLVGKRGLENNQAVTDLLIAANRDPRMGEVTQEYLEQWYELGGNLFVNFSDIQTPSKWGSWGALESVYQDGSPKYDAIVDFINDSSI